MDAGTTNGVDLGELAFAVTKLTIRVDGWISELSCLPSSAQLINAPSVDSNLTSNASLKTSILQSRSGPVLSLNTPLSPTPPVRHRQSARQAFLAPATHQPAGRGRGAEILEELSLSPVASHRIWSHSLPREPAFYSVSVAHSSHRAHHHPNRPTDRLSRPDQKRTPSNFPPQPRTTHAGLAPPNCGDPVRVHQTAVCQPLDPPYLHIDVAPAPCAPCDQARREPHRKCFQGKSG